MKIAVALCTYNGAAFLPEQLASIANQTRLPDEMVACDDGSTDSTVEILENFAASAPFPFRIDRNEQNLGSTKNFEKTIQLCQADVIATADQDDVWHDCKLASVEAVFNRSPDVGLVFSDANLIDDKNQPIDCTLWKSVRFGRRRRRSLAQAPNAFAELLKRPTVTGATMAFCSRYRDLFLPIPARWVHDEWIALLVSAAARIVPIALPLMSYRRHGANQVGVSGVTAGERARRSINSPASRFRERCEDFAILRNRIIEKLPDRLDLITRIDGKIGHLEARSSLPEGRLRRLPSLVAELITMRYRRYSGTSLGFVRDLVATRS